MCLLMWKPAEVMLTKRDVYDYVENNPDGFGILWKDDTGTIRSHKMLGSKKKVWRAYQRYAAGIPCALHWRWNTAGANSMANTHPFEVVPGVWMMHNGVLSCKSDALRSDTWYFANDVMKRELEHHPERIEDETYLKALKEVIGSGNRLLFWRDGQEEPSIVGEEDGIWQNGAWYSNTYAWSRNNPYYFDYVTNMYDDNHPWGNKWKDEGNICNLIERGKSDTSDTQYSIEFNGQPQTKDEWQALEDLDLHMRVWPHADVWQEIDRLVNSYAAGYTWIERSRLRKVLEVAAAGDKRYGLSADDLGDKDMPASEGFINGQKVILNAAGDVLWSVPAEDKDKAV